MTTDPVERLADLLDQHDLAALCLRYATALDTRDWDLLATCFTPDAVAHYDGMPSCEGYRAIETLCRDALSPLDRSQHLIGNVVATVDGDRAVVSCYLQAQHVRSGVEGGENYIIAGRHTDEALRTGEGWRVVRRRLETWWTSGNPAVVGG